MINVGFRGPLTVFNVGDRNELYRFFMVVSDISNRFYIKNSELITDRFFKRYIKYSDVDLTLEAMRKIEDTFITLGLGYERYFQCFYKMIEEFFYLKSINNLYGRLQVTIADLPFAIYDKYKSDQFYDNLTNFDEPYWMRNILDDCTTDKNVV